jgi:hypothetical protein
MSEGNDGTTIFQNEPVATTIAATIPETTSTGLILPEEVKSFVGEGKKYATVEDALKSVPHAQKYIDDQKATLTAKEAEVEHLKEELAKRKAMEEYLAELKNQQVQTSNSSVAPPVDLDSLVERKLHEMSETQKVRDNLLAVDTAMKKQYGEKAKEVFSVKAQELGVSVDYLTKLAGTSPTAFYKMFDLKALESRGVHTSQSINSEGLISQNPSATSARINKIGATSEDMVSAWRNAKPKEN